MKKRIVLVGPDVAGADLRSMCEVTGLEPVMITAEAGVDAVVGAARESGARGVYAAGPGAWPCAVAAARRLRFPCMPLAADGASPLPEAWRALIAAGTPTAESVVVEDLDAAEATLEQLGTPCWLRALDGITPPRCLVLEHADDLPLLFLKARGHGQSGPILMQRPVAGDAWRVVGFKLGRFFHAVEAYQAWMRRGAYRLAERIGIGVAVVGAPYGALMSLARKAATALPPGHGPVEVEIVRGPTDPMLTAVEVYPGITPEVDLLLREGLGLDFQCDALRVAAGDTPHASPGFNLGAAVLWLDAGCGVVARVEGLEAARTLPGVCEVAVRARKGDRLGHIVDRASRGQAGYVAAVASSLHEACARAEAARRAIRIETRPLQAEREPA